LEVNNDFALSHYRRKKIYWDWHLFDFIITEMLGKNATWYKNYLNEILVSS